MNVGSKKSPRFKYGDRVRFTWGASRISGRVVDVIDHLDVVSVEWKSMYTDPHVTSIPMRLVTPVKSKAVKTKAVKTKTKATRTKRAA